MGILLFLFAKTPLAVSVCVIALFGLLAHPVWNFWWIENNIGRRIVGVTLLAIGCCLIGYAAWPETPDGSASMRIDTPQFSRDTSFPLQVDQPLGINFFAKNDGPATAENVHYYTQVGFIRQGGTQEEEDREIDELFKTLYRRVNIVVQNGDKGAEVSPEDETRYFSAVIKSLTKENVETFAQNKKAICAIARVEYNNTQWVERCVFLPYGRENFVFCKRHNDSGVRRAGSLL